MQSESSKLWKEITKTDYFSVLVTIATTIAILSVETFPIFSSFVWLTNDCQGNNRIFFDRYLFITRSMKNIEKLLKILLLTL